MDSKNNIPPGTYSINEINDALMLLAKKREEQLEARIKRLEDAFAEMHSVWWDVSRDVRGLMNIERDKWQRQYKELNDAK